MATVILLAAIVVGIVGAVFFARRSTSSKAQPAAPTSQPSAGAEREERAPQSEPDEPDPVVATPIGKAPTLFSLPPSEDADSVTRVRPLFSNAKLGGSEAPATRAPKPVVHFEPGSEGRVEESSPGPDLIWTPAAGRTDRGVTRMRNEDAYLIDHDLGLYVIADGMGGYAAGDVAARLAVQEVLAAIRAGDALPSAADANDTRPAAARELVAAVERANAVVLADATKNGNTFMGTTLVAARFSRSQQRLYVAHVGDSRCYRLRGGQLKALTTDHTHAALGATGPEAVDLYRAVGIAPTVEVDLIVDRPEHGDIYMFCSDGLHRMVDDRELEEILNRWRSDMDRANSALVLAANAKGGRDNVSVISIAIRQATPVQEIGLARAEASRA
jgi:protein phosphatase